MNARCHWCKAPIATVRMTGGEIQVVEPGHCGDGWILARPVQGGDFIGGYVSYGARLPAGFQRLLPHRAVCEKRSAA